MSPAFVGTIPVATFDEATNTINVQIGPEGLTKDLSTLAALATGTTAQDTLWSNIAISAVLDGVNLTNPVEVVAHINRNQFKYYR